MLTGLFGTFRSMIAQSKWMDTVTKAAAIKKANELVKNVAYPYWMLNQTILEAKYPPYMINITHGTDWFHAFHQLKR